MTLLKERCHRSVAANLSSYTSKTIMSSVDFLRITDRVKANLPSSITSDPVFISYRIENVKTRDFQWIGDKLIDKALGKENVTDLIAEFDNQKLNRKLNTTLEWDILAERTSNIVKI